MGDLSSIPMISRKRSVTTVMRRAESRTVVFAGPKTSARISSARTAESPIAVAKLTAASLCHGDLATKSECACWSDGGADGGST